MSRRNVGPRLPLTIAAVALSTLAVAACGGSDNGGGSASTGSSGASGGASSGGSGVATAKADAQKFVSLPTWKAPGPAVDASKVKGKTCAYVPVAANIPFTNSSYAAFQAAAKDVGVSAKFFSTAGSPQTWSAAINRAVGQGVDCIVTQGVNLAVVQSAVKQATAAKIPIIESFIRQPDEQPNPGAFAEVGPSCRDVGTALGANAVAKTNGDVKAAIFTSSDSPCSDPLVAGIKDEVAKTCGSKCALKVVDVPVADWATKLGSETSSILTASPDTNWLFPLYDGEMPYVRPAVRQAGKATSVDAGSYNATPGIVNELTQSNGILAADVGSPYDWYGYSLMDEALRAMTGMKAAPPQAERIPVVLFTSDNFTAQMANEPSGKWYGDAGAQVVDNFRQLWGVQ